MHIFSEVTAITRGQTSIFPWFSIVFPGKTHVFNSYCQRVSIVKVDVHQPRWPQVRADLRLAQSSGAAAHCMSVSGGPLDPEEGEEDRSEKAGEKKRWKTTILNGYPLVIKHGNGKSPINGGFNRKIIAKWSIFHCHVWLPEGKSTISMVIFQFAILVITREYL